MHALNVLEGESTTDYTEEYQGLTKLKVKCRYVTLCIEVGY